MPTASASESVKTSTIRKFRMSREDSAIVYFVLEAHEGICSYSTLPHVPGELHRDMILRIPPGMESEVEQALAPFGDRIHELI